MTQKEPERLKGTSLDIAEDNRLKLKQLFPTVFTETINESGKLVESIDFEKLKAELGTFTDLFESRREPYGLLWAGKKEALKLIQTHSNATLKPCREESVNFDTTENLFIEGDNLEVLKLLQKSYYGKVKMIYIDPPYNTGKEFIYPDNYTESLETYLEYAGLIDGEGRKFTTNTANEGRFHTKWLNMMYPRLYLARNLLRDDGVIFISIDDNEVSNLRKLCDEIFGEDDFVAQFVWQKKYSRDNRPLIGTTHEYILAYTKSIIAFAEVRNLLPPSEESLKVYKNLNNDPKGRWRSIPLTAQAGHATPNQFYEITAPTGVKHTPPPGRCWSVTKERFDELLNEGRIYFGKEGSSQPNLIRYIDEIKGFVPWTWLPSNEVGHTDSAMKEFYSILSKEALFDTPKPTSLIKHFLKIAAKTNDLICDFFSGTATTARAVMQLNAEDGGNRKFIMVQLPEPCPPDSEAFKAKYKTIADIGKARIRRVIERLTPQPPLHREGEFDFSKKNNIEEPNSLPFGEGWGGASCINGEERGGADKSYKTADPKFWESLKEKARDMRKNPTPAEDAFWQEVRNDKWGISFRRQHVIDRFIVDFVCLEHNLVIEIDGSIHDSQKERDNERSTILNSLGYRVLRFTNEEILSNINSIKSKILNSLTSGEGRGGASLGFKVLKLDKSNFKEWQQLDPSASVEKIEQELFNHIDHINPKSTPEDLLYEILLKAGFTLTEKIETITIADTKVFSIADGGLLLCLEKSVTKELIDAVAEAEPMHFICLDSAFHGNDQLKANTVQTFAVRNMQREKHNQIKFETV